MARKSVRQIRCAMTDEEFHALVDQLGAGKVLATLVLNHAEGTVGAGDSEVIVGLGLIMERLENAGALMQSYWDKTVAPRRAPVEA